jgi:hypothetical protein
MGQRHALANVFVLHAPWLVALVLVVILPATSAPVVFTRVTLSLLIFGLALFLLAKFSLLRRGIGISFGSAQMSTWNRRAYRGGYTLMLLGSLCALALLSAI